ncbi:hypothetical protein [Pseudomonas asplenii]|uniref:hypothetical protein n=1 Tax=Pseudomonas asplenii TaxID=53407 RepID=UPI00128F24D5|nr:hypothetical protein [Pseudomonas fuscovaginae]
MKDKLTEVTAAQGIISGQLATAFIAIILVLKKQPGFDIESFDRDIQRLIDLADIGTDRNVTDEILRSVLESPQDIVSPS